MAEIQLPIFNVKGFNLIGDGKRPEREYGWLQRRAEDRKVEVCHAGTGLLLRMRIIVGSKAYETLGLEDPRDTFNKSVNVFAALPHFDAETATQNTGPRLEPVVDKFQFVTGVNFSGEGFIVDPVIWRKSPTAITLGIERDLQIHGQFNPSGARVYNSDNGFACIKKLSK